MCSAGSPASLGVVSHCLSFVPAEAVVSDGGGPTAGNPDPEDQGANSQGLVSSPVKRELTDELNPPSKKRAKTDVREGEQQEQQEEEQQEQQEKQQEQQEQQEEQQEQQEQQQEEQEEGELTESSEDEERMEESVKT